MELTVEFNFSAAHHLVEAASRCRAVHGHNYKLFVTIVGPVDEHTGMVMDFHHVDDIVAEVVVSRLDGTDLNERLPCPTAERLIEWIGEQLDGPLPQWRKLVLFETPRYSVTHRNPHRDGP